MRDGNDFVERICPNCGKIYKADPKRLKHGRQTTCSRVCSYELRLQTRIAFHKVQETPAKGKKLSPKEKRCVGEKIGYFLPCAVCQKETWVTPSRLRIAKHGVVFCSRSCHYAGRSSGVTKRVVTKPYVYTSEGKAAQLAAHRNPNRKKKQGKLCVLTCLCCKKQFEVHPWQRRSKKNDVFCSLDCCNAYRKGENNPAWRGGYDNYYGPDWRALRRAVRIRDDYTCRRCGKEMKPPHRAPDVHHIRPVGSFENRNDANTLDNVLCLCHTCHMYVEWHGIDFLLS